MVQLIIPAEATSQTYVVGSLQTAFPFSFAVFAKADLHFAVGGVELLQTDFTLAGTLLSGGGYQGGTVNLNVGVSGVTCVLFRETASVRTSNFNPSPTVPVRDIDVALNRLTAIVQDNKRDQPTGGLVVSGVASVAGRTGTVTLAAADVATGFGTAVGASLIAGSNVTLATVGGFTTVSAAGGGAVSSVAGRTGAVTLAVADVGGFAAGVAAGLAAGTNVTLSLLAGVTTINASVTSAVSSVAGRTGAVTLTATDVSSGFGTAVSGALSAGAGISLATAGGITTITSTSGSVPIGYNGAAENTISPTQTAATNSANLNALITSANSAGGGTIWFNRPGTYQINSTINLKSNVELRGVPGAYLQWTAGGAGNIFSSASNDVLVNFKMSLEVDEGTSFSGVVLNLHSAMYCDFKLLGRGTNAASTFVKIAADSSAGEPTYFGGGGINWNRNYAFNSHEFIHRASCGTFIYMAGIAVGYQGVAQGVTDCVFRDCQAANVYVRGIKIEQWADSHTFSGRTYIGLQGTGALGFVCNEGRSATPSVYGIHFEHLIVDTFGTGMARTGVVLFESKLMSCDLYFNDPEAENGHFSGANCLSYRWMTCTPATNNLYLHEKGFSRGL